MDNATKPILLFTIAITKPSKSCYWCGQPLKECDTCGGNGFTNDSTCKLCNGNGRLCPTHNGDWPGN